MANAFKCGVRDVPVGVDSFSVTGLSLEWVPTNVLMRVRQPAADAPLIDAYLTGTPNINGFTVALSAPANASGYKIDFTCFYDSAGPTPVPGSGDTLAVGYSDLKKAVARFLGYDYATLTTRQIDEVDDIIQSGIRRYYYPPMMDGVDPNFEWSFMRLDGSIETAADEGVYALPDGFGRIAGQIEVVNERGTSIPVIPYGDIVRMRNRSSQTGRPRFAAVESVNEFGDRGQRKSLILFPTPDRAYSLAFKGDADTGKIDAEQHTMPLGGAMFAELIMESCLAVAEQKANDEIGIHTQNFNSLLVSTIQRDRKSGAQNFGRMSCERMW